MRVIPAIDLQDGKCVRLYQGQFDQVTEYSNNPVAIARQFAAMNTGELHVVDLDGARTGTQANTEAIRTIARTTPCNIQLGGGIRYATIVEHWLENGVARCVIGSAAVQNPVNVKEWLQQYGADRIVLALDVDIQPNGEPQIATQGWSAKSDLTLWQCLDEYCDVGLQHVLCTDISRDGAMTGPNIELYRSVVKRYPAIRLQASGGVRNVDDLHRLKQSGADAAITGRAILDGAIKADEVALFQPSA